MAGRLLRGIDIRNHGSGNAGATNTFRILGWKAGLVVALLDAGKGVLAVLLLPRLAGVLPGSRLLAESQILLPLLAGCAAILGHVFPLFAGFRGGKGVATGAGAVFALHPLAASLCLGAFTITLLASGYVSLASMTAAVLLPVWSLLLPLLAGRPVEPVWSVFSLLMAAAILFLHRRNIGRLVRGEERRFESVRLLSGRFFRRFFS